MASTGVYLGPESNPNLPMTSDTSVKSDKEEKGEPSVEGQASFSTGDQTHRKLKSRHIQLIGTHLSRFTP